MHPVLFRIGPFTVYAYGAMLALAVMACSVLLSREARRAGISPDVIYDLAFWVVIGGLSGARLFFIFLNASYFLSDPGEILMIHHGGLAWQGGLVLGTTAGVIYLRRKKRPLLKMLDLCLPYAALGQAIGRLGCFLNGCCEGRPFAHGIYFPVHRATLHPTQLYSAFNLALIFIFLKYYQRRAKREGDVFVLYLVLSSAERFFVQFLRADYQPIVGPWGVFQIVNVVIILLAVYANLYLHRRRQP